MYKAQSPFVLSVREGFSRHSQLVARRSSFTASDSLFLHYFSALLKRLMSTEPSTPAESEAISTAIFLRLTGFNSLLSGHMGFLN